MDEEGNVLESETSSEKKHEESQSATGQAADVGKEVVKKQAKQQVEKLAKEAAKKGAQASAKAAAGTSTLAALGPILFWVIVVILAIIIIVGIIMFFMTMPGMVTEQLKSFAMSFVKQIASFYGADTTTMIEEEEKYEVLDYLEQMGYDLKGYGFISKDANRNSANYDAKQGVIRHADTGLIKEAYTDIIGVYLMSDNYVYTVKNFNTTGIWAYLTSILKTTHPIIWNFLDTFVDETAWGKGLITIKFEDGRDYQKNLIDQLFGTNTSWLNIKIDPEAKTLGIRRGWGANYYEYNLDGWTGRYGMPIEFLLSVHIATMKPDLAYEMVTTFDTNIDMRLKDVGGKIDSLYKNNSGNYVSYREVESLIHIGASDDILTSVINWFDDWRTGNEEVARLFGLGFEHVCYGTDDECDLSGEEKTMETVDENGNTGTITYTKAKNISQACKDNILAIISELKRANDYNFDTYVPYIKNVTKHWFRDVYFVLSQSEVNNLRLTRNDVDYEKLTNERWTEYERYESGEKIGEYKLYIYDKDTSEDNWELYTKSKEEADKEGITVVKRQIKTYASDLENDGLLTLKDDGSWSAYEIKDTHSESYKRVYPDAAESTIQGKIYYKETMDSNVVQKYDGLRGVTNQEIKEMFLTRNYLNYDGNAETASVIKKLRDDVLHMKYGSIDDSKLDTDFTVNIDVPDENGALVSKTVSGKVGDYVSKVSITQDSLAAFSMLENTHTQDSDFIYKDFKELIVELGYFEKEELSDGRKKLLQWLIPEIGSGGYPRRSLDKRENEYGTLAHSKEDYEINQKNTLAALLEGVDPTTDSPEGAENGPDALLVSKSMEKSLKSVNKIATLDSTPMANFTSVRGANISTCDYTFTSTGNSGMGVKRGDLELDGVAYEVWQQTHSTCTLYSLAFICNAYTGQPFEEYIKANGVLVNKDYEGQGPGNKYWAAGAGVIWAPMEEETGGGVFYTASNKPANMGELVVEALGEGKPVYFYGSYASSAGYHAVVLLGKDSDGSLLIYNPGGGTLDNYGSGDFLGIVNQLIQTEGFNMPGHTIFIPDNPPEGRKESGESYEGYKGNEAVVSPVTGILLEYGTYTDEDVANGYRKNFDMPEETDKVGYAKILVLDEFQADQITGCTKHGLSGKIDAQNVESRINSGITNSISSDEKVNVTEIIEDNLSEAEKALYGYDLFCEEYENNKIAGYMIYIDGFKCELPGEVAESENEDESLEIVTPGETLSMDYFKSKAATGSNSSFTICEYGETLYEKDETYNLISDKMEARSKAEAEVKDIATPLYKFTGYLEEKDVQSGTQTEMIVIKEGTVIGRTLTDKELVEDYRGDVYVSEEDARVTETDPNTGETKEVDSREVRGNYLRIIMKDLDDTVVENVEDYMKLDEEGNSKFDGEFSEEFLFWLAFLLEGLRMEDCVDGYCTAEIVGATAENPAGDGTITAGPGVTNHCNALFWELGYEKYMHYRRGSNVGMEVGDQIPIDVLIDVMMLYLEGTLETLEQDFPGNSFDEFQVAALVSVYYNFGSVPESLKNAINNNGNIQYVWEHLSDSQQGEFPGLPKRRKAEYKMFNEGIWVDAYSGDEIHFKSDTPFTDALNGRWPL